MGQALAVAQADALVQADFEQADAEPVVCGQAVLGQAGADSSPWPKQVYATKSAIMHPDAKRIKSSSRPVASEKRVPARG